MIENKALYNRMAAEWIKEFMYQQKEFTARNIMEAMPLAHLGVNIDFICSDENNYIMDLINELIVVYAKKYGYAKSGNVWKQSNQKPEPSFEVNPNENYDDCDGVLPDPVAENLNEKVNLVAPFYNYTKKLRALLGADPEVTVVEDESKKVINICVAGCDKPDAYRIFFPGTVELGAFGTVTILVNGHKKTYKTIADESVLRNMFTGNPLFKEVLVTHFATGQNNRLFVIFKNQTVQYKNDNFSSLAGVTTTTAEDLARELLKGSGMVIWWTTETEFDYDFNPTEELG